MSLNGYHILISGGTGGLGREVVNRFSKKGANVVTNFRTENRFEELKSAVTFPERVHGIKADLTTENGVAGFFSEYKSQHGRLDAYLHLMGGFWMGGEIAETPLKEWNRMMEINLTAAFLGCREAFRLMKKQCHGKIFTVAARTALELPAGMGAYSVSKAAVLALTETLAKEGKPYNIQANCVLPGIIDTPANRQAMPEADFKEWVTPGQIGELLVALTGVEQTVLNGTSLKVY